LRKKESKLRISLEQFLSFIAIKELRLAVTGGCNSSRHQRFMRDKFFKNKLVKTFPSNSMTSERLGKTDIL